ncbi:uncharacterized protein LOC127281914 isoform X2 [Leptopilina boulardi]|nr:uncharacterized protein LOC127281914 isoform X2 [Leptopilina boulardi]
MPQRPMSGSPSGTALTLHLRSSSFSPSLVSPGDSGVALDSDMDLSNETDGSSCREDSSIEDIPRYRNSKYKTILSNCTKDMKNMDRSFSSSDSSEDGKTTKFQKTLVTTSDIVNQNFPQKLDDNEIIGSSLDTLKDYSYYSKSLEESKVNNDFDNIGSNRYSYYGDNASYSFKKNIDPRNSYVINNDTNLLELSMTISDCDSTEAPYSILNTINMVDTSILSTSSSETVVQRRQRKKKRGEGKKRVSFHEDIFKMMKLDDDENYEDFSMNYRSPYQNQKKKDVQQERYSWCANGDSPYIKETIDTRNAYSEYYSSSSSLSTHDSENERRLTTKLCNHPVCQKNYRCTCLSISERGVPEGQEDPQINARPKMEIDLKDNEAQEAYIVEKEYGNIIEDPPVKLEMPNKLPNTKSDWSDVDSVTTCDSDDRKNRHLASPQKKRNMTAILSGENSKLLIPPLRQVPSKTSLLNRFLRSITERKFDVKKNKKPKSNQLYIKCAKVDQDSFKEFNRELEKEIQDNQDPDKRRFSGEKISFQQKEIFKHSIYRDKTEQLYKVYKVRSSYMTNGESKPMLALLTDKTLYLTSSKSDHTYRNQFVIPYNELDVIMLGPNAQTILISNADNEMQYLFSTGSAETTWELIAHLEMAMRRSPSKPRLPAVRELSYDDMHSLRHSILAETAVNLEEKIEHYNIIYMEDEHISPPSTPCGPTKEGDLMFRPHTYQSQYPNAPTNAWEAGYFVLKGGVVYMFTDSSQRLPKRAIPLKGGLCQGCRRIPNSHRPHTFEILLKSNKSFQFAAPDEYVASEWLQSFIQSASGLFDSCEKREPLPCSLVVSSRHLIAINEVFPGTQRGQILSCASIQDLTALRMPLTNQSWCVLEFACREVHESNGDWVVYFTNYAEFCTFRKILETLWNNVHEEDFPVITIQPEDKLNQRCTEVSKDLENAWQYLLPIAPE